MIALIVALAGIGILYWLVDYGLKQMEEETESYDEFIAEQSRLSYEMNKKFGVKPNKLTQINAVKENKND